MENVKMFFWFIFTMLTSAHVMQFIYRFAKVSERGISVLTAGDLFLLVTFPVCLVVTVELTKALPKE